MNGNYGGGGPWGGPPMSGGSKMAAIHQCLDAMRPLSPRPAFVPQPPPTMAALDALPEPFCPQVPPPPSFIHEPPPAPVQTCEVPMVRPAEAAPAACPAPTPTEPAARATGSERAAAVLRSPALLALATAVVVVLVLIVVAPPFVLRKRSGAGAHGDPAWRWARPRAQVDPVRLLVWGVLAGAAAFALPLAIDRVTSPPASSPTPAKSIPRRRKGL